jgi:hypothetical protein
MIKGYLVDVYPDYKHDVMVIWIKTKKNPIAIKQPYRPSFYVSASSSDLRRLELRLTEHPDVNHLNRTTKKTCLGSEKKNLRS